MSAGLGHFAKLRFADGLLLAVLAVLGYALLHPHFKVDDVVAAEREVRIAMTALHERLQSHRDDRRTDVDGDGRGEFPPLGSILRELREQFTRVEGTDTWIHIGYYFTVLLPDRNRKPVRATSPEVTTDYAEVACFLAAWPIEPGRSGMRAYCWTPADGVLKHAVDGYPYGGADSPLVPPGAMVDGIPPDVKPTHYAGDAWVNPR